ncbi:MAG TPA: hypothetical protein VMU19_08075 [Bryobacteraceae bacterium]|nr:hypothetical protein [Bryobacteraceae bacterium]
MATAPPGADAGGIQAAVEAFVRNARQPALYEAGEHLLPLAADNFALEMRGSRLTIAAWDRTRNFSRRILGVERADSARMEITVERFGRREGKLFLVDLSRPAGADAGRRSARLVFRERVRLFLRRQFPDWDLAELTAEANLARSLSPAFPRAFLKRGQHGWAAIACPPEGDAAAALTFGLIWLDYLRAREKRLAVEGLALYAPAGAERAVAPRLLCLDPASARFDLLVYSREDYVAQADPRDYGNFDTRLEPWRRPPLPEEWERVAALPGVERVPKHDGRESWRVRGVEFAEASASGLSFGLAERRPAARHHAAEIERLAGELYRARAPEAADREHPLYRQAPEAWLESQVRAAIETVDASLRPAPVYGQTPVMAAGERGVIDLLAADHNGRLAVVELKASADPHLPLQALDYWVRVKWHLDRGEFAAAGYFPGVQLRPEAPRLLLVAPSLEFHSTTEQILRYFAPSIEVQRIGLAVEWRKELRVMFRLNGAEQPR